MDKLLSLTLGLVTALYPLAVYFSLTHVTPRAFGGVLIGLGALRWYVGKRKHTPRQALWPALAAGIAALWMLVGNSETAVRAYPVLVNATLGSVFAWSLYAPPTVIERFARLQEAQLSPTVIAYTRKVTWVWLGFFLLNGAIAAYTTWWGSLDQWTLYNGMISYLLMGSLFVGEWLVRQRVKRREAA